MTIRLASPEDNEHIFKIWYACFTDDQAYIMNYLKYCLPYTKTWVLGVENGEFVSCLSIIPSYFILNSKIIRGGYLYAVGTLPEHRGNSYSKIAGKRFFHSFWLNPPQNLCSCYTHVPPFKTPYIKARQHIMLSTTVLDQDNK